MGYSHVFLEIEAAWRIPRHKYWSRKGSFCGSNRDYYQEYNHKPLFGKVISLIISLKTNKQKIPNQYQIQLIQELFSK
jgi:hypothetical protein